MSETIKKRICDICDIISENHLYTKEYINEHIGEYPVYSATLGNPFGYIDSYNFESIKVLMVVNYGNSGNTYLVCDDKFSIGRNVCGLCIKEEYKSSISLEYIQTVSTPLFIKRAKGEKQKNLNKRMISETIVEIPVLSNGMFDLETQNELAQKYKDIEEKKKILLDKIETMKNNKIVFDNDMKRYEQVSITDLFTPKNGNGSYTKEWCQNHQGEIPLYSGNTVGSFASIDIADYDGEFITWAKDGLAGKMMYHNGKFSITGHRGILIPTEKCRNVDLQYMKWVIEPIFRKNIKGRIGINGKNEYTTLNSVMIKNIKEKIYIPINEDGSYNLEKQQELAQKYATIETIKQNLYSQVKELVSITIN